MLAPSGLDGTVIGGLVAAFLELQWSPLATYVAEIIAQQSDPEEVAQVVNWLAELQNDDKELVAK